MTPEQAYDIVADEYDLSFSSDISLAEDRVIKSDLKEFFDGGSVLDIGCGTGYLLDLMPITPSRYTGIDISGRMIEVARKKHPEHQFIKSDAYAFLSGLIKSGEKYDYIISLWCALSYAPKQTVTLINDCLNDNGKFYLMLYTKRYPKRKSYILNKKGISCPLTFYHELENSLPSGFVPVGLNFTGDMMKFGRFTTWLMLKSSYSTIGHIYPSGAYIIIVSGRKCQGVNNFTQNLFFPKA